MATPVGNQQSITSGRHLHVQRLRQELRRLLLELTDRGKQFTPGWRITLCTIADAVVDRG